MKYKVGGFARSLSHGARIYKVVAVFKDYKGQGYTVLLRKYCDTNYGRYIYAVKPRIFPVNATVGNADYYQPCRKLMNSLEEEEC